MKKEKKSFPFFKILIAVVLAVAHTEFSKLDMPKVESFFAQGRRVLIDIKGILDRKAYENADYLYWRL